MGHPNGKVARYTHSVFVAFMSSGKDLNEDSERVSLKEQLVFYYLQRSLEVLILINLVACLIDANQLFQKFSN